MNELQVIREKLNEVIDMDILEKTLCIVPGLSGYVLKGDFSKEFIADIYNKYQGSDYRMNLNSNYEKVLKDEVGPHFTVYNIEEIIVFMLEYYANTYHVDRTSETDHIIANVYRELLSDLINHREYNCGVVGELLKSLKPDLARLEEYQNKVYINRKDASFGVVKIDSDEVISFLNIVFFDISSFTFVKDNKVTLVNFSDSQMSIECEVNIFEKDVVREIKWKKCAFDGSEASITCKITQNNSTYDVTGDEDLFYDVINAAIIKVKNMYEIKDILELKKDNN